MRTTIFRVFLFAIFCSALAFLEHSIIRPDLPIEIRFKLESLPFYILIAMGVASFEARMPVAFAKGFLACSFAFVVMEAVDQTYPLKTEEDNRNYLLLCILALALGLAHSGFQKLTDWMQGKHSKLSAETT